MSKQRLSASVDEELIEAAEKSVARGDSESVSAWVNDALRLKLAQERRLEALAAFIAGYEGEHGEITLRRRCEWPHGVRRQMRSSFATGEHRNAPPHRIERELDDFGIGWRRAGRG